MVDTTLTKKLLIKPDKTHLILNAPNGYLDMLADRPASATIQTSVPPHGTNFDLVQLFVRTQKDLREQFAVALDALSPGGIMWVAFPKKTGKIKTDMSRDHGWEPLSEHDWHPVTLIAIDDTWSSMRVRPRAEIKVMTRKF